MLEIAGGILLAGVILFGLVLAAAFCWIVATLVFDMVIDIARSVAKATGGLKWLSSRLILHISIVVIILNLASMVVVAFGADVEDRRFDSKFDAERLALAEAARRAPDSFMGRFGYIFDQPWVEATKFGSLSEDAGAFDLERKLKRLK
jgi:hypothetical protein